MIRIDDENTPAHGMGSDTGAGRAAGSGSVVQASGDSVSFRDRHAELERQSAADGGRWLAPLRKQAFERFQAVGYPSTRLEDWKYFNLAPLRKTRFQHVPERKRVALRRETLAGFEVHCLTGAQLVFVDGYFEPTLSTTRTLPEGIELGDLATAIQAKRDVLEKHLGKHATMDTNPFVALNTAMLHDGAFVHVARGVQVQDPIHLLFVSTGATGATVSHPRTTIVLEEGASLNLVEDYVSTTDATYFTNPVTEIALEASAVLDYYKLERESKNAYHIAATQVRQSRDSSFESTSISFGGLSVRNDVCVTLDAPGASCSLNGLNVIGDHQLVDDHTVILHRQPHCTSQELYKSILDGHAEGVFNGAILVAQDAQKTSSRQTNRNLVLSQHALMNTKPQLEIHADDVKCSHGATVGELDEESLFYLRTRGIDRDTSRRILTYAFANDVLARIRQEPLRKTVESALFSFIPVAMADEQPC
jgi:Fe-S cluster assembly protein SufD